MPTLSDVARLAGVSTMTVSRVINKKGRVSIEKQEAVKKAIQALNYHPNLAARTLATNCSNTVGLLVTFMKNPVYPVYIEGITAELRKKGLDVILYYADSYESTMSGVHTLLSKQVDGIIMLPLEIPKPSQEEIVLFVEKLRTVFDHNGKPLVIIGNPQIDFGHHILEDYYSGVEIAIKHLVSSGHKEIGYIQCSDDTYPWYERTNGFLNSMKKYGLAMNEDWQVSVPERLYDVETIVGEWVRLLLDSRKPLPTALYCANDLIALGTMHALQLHGIQIPNEMSIIGHDGSIISEYAFPRLTTVSISAYDTGQTAAELLANILESTKTSRVKTIRMSTELVAGETVKVYG